MRRLLWLVLLVACSGVVACSINTEATGTGSDVDSGAVGGMGGSGGIGAAGIGGGADCFPNPDQKFCGGQNCPLKTDPAHGCASPSCAPCSLSNAQTDCAADGSCGIQNCNQGFSDCDNSVDDGCEVNTAADPKNCGSCGHDCYTPGDATNWACNNGTCEVSNCPTGRGDCNKDPADKCEVDLTSDPANCSFCGNDCSSTVQHATPSCTAGKCGYSKCDPGWADCDGDPTNGCEQDIATDATNCGKCGNVCNTTNGQAACVAGVCKITCNTGYGDCLPGGGCETNLKTNPAHCGKCGTICSTNHSTPTCNAGTCVVGCQSGFADCNGQQSDGCEANLSSPSTCGSCSKNCNNLVKNATATCSGGNCSYSGSCNAGWGDCSGGKANGCETRLNTTTNCGSCGSACSPANATGTCTTGSCAIASCTAPYKDCGGGVGNGCETNTSTNVNNCGSCGNNCTTNVQHASGVACSSGACTYTGSCAAGWGDCSGGAANGCETQLTTTTNCGSCGTACSPAHATGTCSTGTCAIASCTAPYKDCSGGVADGCETNTSNNTTNCGSCGNNCTTSVQNATGVACTSGACSYSSCSSGWGNCDSKTSNGCETDLTQLANCGSCGNNCTTSVQHATPTCTSGTCGYSSCASGWADCDSDTTNGCEADLTAPATCGSCGKDCTTQVLHAAATCTSGTCGYSSCASGWGDCDSDTTNGCETDLTSDATCGSCSNKCVGGLHCKLLEAGVGYSCLP